MVAPRRFLPSISSLRALEALDRLGSASAAAEELCLTQGAVSRQLQTLEKQLDLVLVDRSHKRLMLTEQAGDYAREIRQALGQIAQATLKVQSMPVGGQLNLAILPTFGMRWLVPRLPDFSRRHPDVTLNMGTRLQMFPFAGERFDAALHYGTGNWPGAEAMLLKGERLIPICSPDLLATREIADPTQILTLPLLHIQTRPNAWQDWFTAVGVPAPQAAYDQGTHYDQFSTILQAVLHGLGAALVPDYLVEQDLAQGKVVALHPTAVEAEGAYYLVWPREKSENPALKKFKDWLAPLAQPEDTLPR